MMTTAFFDADTLQPLDEQWRAVLEQKLNNKTKPVGSLGAIESVALRIGMIQKSLCPALHKPQVLIFAGDHGVCDEGISAFPQEVTPQMVTNFLAGGAAISVLAKQHGLALQIIDAGVKGELTAHPQLLQRKIAEGTRNFTRARALECEQVVAALEAGAAIVESCHNDGTNVFLIGEMGIGNTTSAAALTHLVSGAAIADCVGAGTGLDARGIAHKTQVIERALAFHRTHLATPIEQLAAVGGCEIAMMTGAYLKAASLGCVLVIDGFIATAALAMAYQMNPRVIDYCIFSHGSSEQGHGVLLRFFDRAPLLSLGLRLGEGSGAALAYPLIVSALQLLNEMASFESAGVSDGQS